MSPTCKDRKTYIKMPYKLTKYPQAFTCNLTRPPDPFTRFLIPCQKLVQIPHTYLSHKQLYHRRYTCYTDIISHKLGYKINTTMH